jgi:chromate transporter
MIELALLFLRLGATAFGGPAAHIAFMEEEVVRRRQWMSREEFLDLLGATNLIPGPNSTEMAIHIGYRREGWPGLLIAGVCFILPATLIVGAIAWLYVRYARLPQAEAVLYGIKPVIIAIVADALWRLAKTAMKTPLLAGAAIEPSCSSRTGPSTRSRSARAPPSPARSPWRTSSSTPRSRATPTPPTSTRRSRAPADSTAWSRTACSPPV